MGEAEDPLNQPSRFVLAAVAVLFLVSAVWVLIGGNVAWVAISIGLAAAVRLKVRNETQQVLADAEIALADFPLLASILDD